MSDSSDTEEEGGLDVGVPLRFSTVVHNVQQLIDASAPSLATASASSSSSASSSTAVWAATPEKTPGREMLTTSQEQRQAHLFLGSVSDIKRDVQILIEAQLSSPVAAEEKIQKLFLLLEQLQEAERSVTSRLQSAANQSSEKDISKGIDMRASVMIPLDDSDRSDSSDDELVDVSDISAVYTEKAPLLSKHSSSASSEASSSSGAAAAASSSSSRALELKAHSSSSVKEESMTGYFSCPICMDDECALSERRALSGCDHVYCASCLSGYLSVLIADGRVTDDEMICPSPDCTSRILTYELEYLLPRATWERYLQFSVLSYLETQADTRWCPSKKCGAAVLGNPGQDVVCPDCQLHFCFDCSLAPHPGHTCAENKAQLAARGLGDKDDEQLAQWAEKANTRNCPSCSTLIESSGGCNHYRCTRCNHEFCWLCLQPYEPMHYAKEGPCRMRQFTLDDGSPDPAHLFFDPAQGVFVDVATGAQLNQRQVYNRTATRGQRARRRAKKVGKVALIGTGVALAAPVALAVVVAGVAVSLPVLVPYGIVRAIRK